MARDRDQRTRVRGRLTAYLEIAYRYDAAGFSTDRAFVQFLVALRLHVDRLVLVGRVREGRAAYPIPASVEMHPLPDYPTLKHIGSVLRAVPRTFGELGRATSEADHVLSIGPHPMSLPAALLALARRRNLALMVRQDYPTYIRHRLPSSRWLPAVGLAHVFEATFRALARRVPTIVVGEALAHAYRRAPRLLNLTISLVPEQQVGTHRMRQLGEGQIALLSVGRLEPEKAPELLLEMMKLLEDRHGHERFSLTMAGTGELDAQLRETAKQLRSQVVFAGYVTHGEDLFRMYRESDVLVHTALTEGVPQVLIEGQAIGIPIVATDVGGVRKAVADGRAALLVPPRDSVALAEAVEDVVADQERRKLIVQAGLENAGPLTIERQVELMARFLERCWRSADG